jgi:AraC family transcriptional regulator, regulatory protein of adaptative response / methylated-DNA-[protein]-cysteine methyltransferase
MTTMTIETQRTESAFDADEGKWTAVRNRDPLADGQFFYGVRTTGVYCRPSCCKRCRPDEAPFAERQAAAVAQACKLIQEADEMPSLDELAEAAGMSRFHFHRTFRTVTGLTPRAYAAARRASRVRDQLARSPTVTDAIYGAGFNSNGRFYATSAKLLGMTPTEFRAGGSGTAIRFAVGECSLGSILVAASSKGICAIFLGDEPDELARTLQDSFPSAQLVGADAEFENWVATVVGFVEAPALGLDLPLDVRGTAFQQRVWQALSDIRSGSTATYRDIADKIGAPGSARAVAKACASNPLAVAIPCHRVVQIDGSLSGYRWGVERKRALLDREAAAPAAV